MTPKKSSITAQEKIKRKLIETLFFKIYSSIKLISIIKQEKPDFIISGVNLISNYIILKHCKRNNIKLLIEKVDENRRKYLMNKKVKDYIASYYDELFEKIIIPKLDFIFVISNYLMDKYNDRFTSVSVYKAPPTFIDLERFDISYHNHINENLQVILNESKITFMFAGSCVFYNGIFFFLDCLCELLKKNKYNIQVLFLFHKGYVERVREKIIDCKLSNYVNIVENCFPDYIPALYKRVDILILPELGGVVANSGFPGKISEYCAAGKAIISTRFSNIDDYLIHDYNCLMSEMYDMKKYIENLERLITSAKLRHYLGFNSRLTCEKYFDVKKAIRPYAKILLKS